MPFWGILIAYIVGYMWIISRNEYQARKYKYTSAILGISISVIAVSSAIAAVFLLPKSIYQSSDPKAKECTRVNLAIIKIIKSNQKRSNRTKTSFLRVCHCRWRRM